MRTMASTGMRDEGTSELSLSLIQSTASQHRPVTAQNRKSNLPAGHLRSFGGAEVGESSSFEREAFMTSY